MNENKWIKFKYNGKEWEVQENLSKPVKAKDLVIPKGCRLMDVLMAGYIHSYVSEIELSSDWEWVEQFSDKNKKECSYALVGLWFDVPQGGSRLGCRCGGLDGVVSGFGYRLVRENKK